MNVALFGGTFDPVHRGHLAVAKAALASPRFELERIYFVPADIPPHKLDYAVTPYVHRYAMLELALEDEPNMSVSEIELRPEGKTEPNYSIETVRRFKQTISPEDQLYFIIGIDAFLNIRTWREPVALLRECNFIVVSRPGFTLSDALSAAPERARKDHIFLLEGVDSDVSSTASREAAAHNDADLDHFVVPAVAAYIREQRLYAS